MRFASVLAAATIALTGCQLYFGEDDEPPVTCGGGVRPGWGTDDGYPSNLLRNPQTGECEEFGGYGGGYGGNCYYDSWSESCVCDDVAVPPPQPVPNWPACESSCTILDEETCLSEPGCQVAYWEEVAPSNAPLFRGCYATTGGPDIYASCFNLDAYGCAQHDSCSIFYTADYPMPAQDSANEQPPWAQFTQCRPEPTNAGCSAVDCGPGYRCEDSCYETPGPNGVLTTQCTPMCVPDSNGCAAITCAPGYECVETCDTMPPSAAEGGCFPGQCEASCVPTTACEMLTTEGACDARSDCTSVYSGDDCTCYPGGYCECAILTWDHCESLGVVPMPL